MNSRVIFLPVPEYLHELFLNEEQKEFLIDPDIPIPVEIPWTDNIENNSIENILAENISIDSITIESILTAMLRVIGERQVEQEWIDYYSRFVLFLRPDIITKLKERESLADEDYLKALKLIKDGNAGEALAHIRVFIERNSLAPNGWFILGWALRLLGRWQDAQAALRKAIELGADNSDTRNELAICLMETGDIAGAKRELETALYNDPENTKIISNLGTLSLKQGDKEKAAAFFRTVLEIDSGDPIAKKYLEEI